MPPRPHEEILGPTSRAALAAVRARAIRRRGVDRRRIECVLAGAGIDADIASLTAAAPVAAPVTLNFHPDRRIADGRTVAEALRDEGLYRSQFETGISNGGLSAFPGGDRDEWERRLFAGAYQPTVDRPSPAAARPKYGGLNLAGFTNGPAPAFGSCALVLGHDAHARTTFLFGDSSERHEDIGTADAFEPVLAALLERVAATGRMLGLPRVSVPELIERLTRAAPDRAVHSRVLDDYIETHTHGPIALGSDADAFLLDPSYRDTATADALLQAAERYGLAVRWHEGSRLTLAAFPATTPVPAEREPNRWERFLLTGHARRLAERVVADHGPDGRHLTAAAIGDAARAFAAEPASWSDWGAPDPSLTALKDLWRILATYGSPQDEGWEPPGARRR